MTYQEAKKAANKRMLVLSTLVMLGMVALSRCIIVNGVNVKSGQPSLPTA